MQAHDDSAPMSEIDYFNLTQPQRERPFEAGSTLLAGLALTLGVAAILAVPVALLKISGVAWTPFKTGLAAILLAIIALSTAGPRDRLQRTAFTVAVVGWLIGGILAVIFDKPIW